MGEEKEKRRGERERERERERESCSESGFWHAKLKGFMPANIGFSFRAIKL